ncbi:MULTISPECIES: ATPase [unclassified Mycolicibacterium]|uniref:ATPase n=1 Tax=unclassified Mycolicibacterium TaxID=2636767 RepID=UPI0012DC2E1D|nr:MULTISPECIES: ATPase [unclassified Mycolicibacterium]MUL85271.1 ATPase [Mycolicibacterium sp. CBMA 329]MUL91238.1 ATPase [Mycolicibacterium sp. CBMA 331]MUL98093.1 ATPase [Mycolicibacterium sp. CBMA 334]MUM27771.1 ATPase [Mycolicibacterium sp. CBMA 295]MUM40997.1 ATPase [Mycolicibacterium sp. CBMA 247]
MTTDFDRIEHEIAIDAPAQCVWDLVSEPGWYINDKEITDHHIERDGDVAIVTDPSHGRFALRTVTLDEPRYAAFRWHIDADNLDSSSTLVEFWITPAASGVVLRVVESGFASLDEPEADRRSRFDDHSGGWPVELSLAQRHLAGAAADA